MKLWIITFLSQIILMLAQNTTSNSPLSFPTTAPTSTSLPSFSLTNLPTFSPTPISTEFPTIIPSNFPTFTPSTIPISLPTRKPTPLPSSRPSLAPTALPSSIPTATPTTSQPTAQPSSTPTTEPSSQPTSSPSSIPTTIDHVRKLACGECESLVHLPLRLGGEICSFFSPNILVQCLSQTDDNPYYSYPSSLKSSSSLSSPFPLSLPPMCEYRHARIVIAPGTRILTGKGNAWGQGATLGGCGLFFSASNYFLLEPNSTIQAPVINITSQSLISEVSLSGTLSSSGMGPALGLGSPPSDSNWDNSSFVGWGGSFGGSGGRPNCSGAGGWDGDEGWSGAYSNTEQQVGSVDLFSTNILSGSGGWGSVGSGKNWEGGRGGGIIRIDVSFLNLTSTARILSQGGDSFGSGMGGGSGGSVALRTDVVLQWGLPLGSDGKGALISVAGGSAKGGWSGAGGGGGRVTLKLPSTSPFPLSIGEGEGLAVNLRGGSIGALLQSPPRMSISPSPESFDQVIATFLSEPSAQLNNASNPNVTVCQFGAPGTLFIEWSFSPTPVPPSQSPSLVPTQAPTSSTSPVGLLVVFNSQNRSSGPASTLLSSSLFPSSTRGLLFSSSSLIAPEGISLSVPALPPCSSTPLTYHTLSSLSSSTFLSLSSCPQISLESGSFLYLIPVPALPSSLPQPDPPSPPSVFLNTGSLSISTSSALLSLGPLIVKSQCWYNSYSSLVQFSTNFSLSSWSSPQTPCWGGSLPPFTQTLPSESPLLMSQEISSGSAIEEASQAESEFSSVTNTVDMLGWIVQTPSVPPSQALQELSVLSPLFIPTNAPTPFPTQRPTFQPSTRPPTSKPTFILLTNFPTFSPSVQPTASQRRLLTFHLDQNYSTFDPSPEPTPLPPSSLPTSEPSTDHPFEPSPEPTDQPTHYPTRIPTLDPTHHPTSFPTPAPTHPTYSPTASVVELIEEGSGAFISCPSSSVVVNKMLVRTLYLASYSLTLPANALISTSSSPLDDRTSTSFSLPTSFPTSFPYFSSYLKEFQPDSPNSGCWSIPYNSPLCQPISPGSSPFIYRGPFLGNSSLIVSAQTNITLNQNSALRGSAIVGCSNKFLVHVGARVGTDGLGCSCGQSGLGYPGLSGGTHGLGGGGGGFGGQGGGGAGGGAGGASASFVLPRLAAGSGGGCGNISYHFPTQSPTFSPSFVPTARPSISYSPPPVHGAGGGVVALEVTSLILDGTLSSSGLSGERGAWDTVNLIGSGAGGGGAGGTVSVNAKLISGSSSGQIKSIGGTGGNVSFTTSILSPSTLSGLSAIPEGQGGGGGGGFFNATLPPAAYSGFSFSGVVVTSGGIPGQTPDGSNGGASSGTEGMIDFPPCPAGYGGQSTVSSSSYSVSAQLCSLCPVGSFKSGVSNSPCIPCSNKPINSKYIGCEGGICASSSCPYNCYQGFVTDECVTVVQNFLSINTVYVGTFFAIVVVFIAFLVYSRRFTGQYKSAQPLRADKPNGFGDYFCFCCSCFNQFLWGDNTRQGLLRKAWGVTLDDMGFMTTTTPSEDMGRILSTHVQGKHNLTSRLQTELLNHQQLSEVQSTSQSSSHSIQSLSQLPISDIPLRDLQSSLRLVETDLPHHTCRIYLLGKNSPFSSEGGSWALNPVLPTHLTPIISPQEFRRMCARLNALLNWNLWSWKVLLYVLCKLIFPPLASFILSYFRVKKARVLLEFFLSYDHSCFLYPVQRRLKHSIRASVSKDATLAYIDILFDEFELINKSLDFGPNQPPPVIPQPICRVGQIQLPIFFPVSGLGSFSSPFSLDTNDLLLQAVPLSDLISTFIDQDWIDFVATLNSLLRCVDRSCPRRGILQILRFLADDQLKKKLGGLEIELSTYNLNTFHRLYYSPSSSAPYYQQNQLVHANNTEPGSPLSLSLSSMSRNPSLSPFHSRSLHIPSETELENRDENALNLPDKPANPWYCPRWSRSEPSRPRQSTESLDDPEDQRSVSRTFSRYSEQSERVSIDRFEEPASNRRPPEFSSKPFFHLFSKQPSPHHQHKKRSSVLKDSFTRHLVDGGRPLTFGEMCRMVRQGQLGLGIKVIHPRVKHQNLILTSENVRSLRAAFLEQDLSERAKQGKAIETTQDEDSDSEIRPSTNNLFGSRADTLSRYFNIVKQADASLQQTQTSEAEVPSISPELPSHPPPQSEIPSKSEKPLNSTKLKTASGRLKIDLSKHQMDLFSLSDLQKVPFGSFDSTTSDASNPLHLHLNSASHPHFQTSIKVDDTLSECSSVQGELFSEEDFRPLYSLPALAPSAFQTPINIWKLSLPESISQPVRSSWIPWTRTRTTTRLPLPRCELFVTSEPGSSSSPSPVIQPYETHSSSSPSSNSVDSQRSISLSFPPSSHQPTTSFCSRLFVSCSRNCFDFFVSLCIFFRHRVLGFNLLPFGPPVVRSLLSSVLFVLIISDIVLTAVISVLLFCLSRDQGEATACTNHFYLLEIFSVFPGAIFFSPFFGLIAIFLGPDPLLARIYAGWSRLAMINDAVAMWVVVGNAPFLGSTFPLVVLVTSMLCLSRFLQFLASDHYISHVDNMRWTKGWDGLSTAIHITKDRLNQLYS